MGEEFSAGMWDAMKKFLMVVCELATHAARGRARVIQASPQWGKATLGP